MEIEHFKLNNSQEVHLFSDRLAAYQKGKLGHSLPYIDLNVAFKTLQERDAGGKVFSALLDLKLNFVMLNIDFNNAGGVWNHYFSKGKLKDGSILTDQQIFSAKTEMHYYYANFIPKYRSIWDKIMGVLILLYMPANYDKYRRAKSRKKEFEKLCKEIPQIADEFVKNVIKGISDFDQNFRTPEIHGTGTIRKWSFTMYSLHQTPLIDLGMYFNWLLPVLDQIDKVIEKIGSATPSKNV